MTTRTFAATAAALPADHPDRRALLATAGAAAVLAAIGAPAGAVAAPFHPDAALLALREPYERTLATMDVLGKPHSRAEEAYFAFRQAEPDLDDNTLRKRSGLVLAERAYNRATAANLKIIDRIAEMPARTLAGVIFKAAVSRRESNMDPALVTSIMDDLAALAGSA